MKKQLPSYVLTTGICMIGGACSALSGLSGGETGVDPQAIGDTVGGIATVATGNPAIGLAVGTIVGGCAAWFFKRRKAAGKA